MTWPALLTLAAGTYLVRLVGLVLGERLPLPSWAIRLLDLGATALLVALAATAALTEAGGFVGWSAAVRGGRRSHRGVAAGAVRRGRRACRRHRGRAPGARGALRHPCRTSQALRACSGIAS